MSILIGTLGCTVLFALDVLEIQDREQIKTRNMGQSPT